MMETLIRQICGLSILCGAALSLAPDGMARKAMSFVCSVVLLGCVLSGVRQLDWQEYAVETAVYREREEELLRRSSEVRDALDRRVIEAEYCAYVLQEAERMGLAASDAQVNVSWSTEGVWVPASVRIQGVDDPQKREQLSQLLQAELGIPKERQEWIEDD